MYCCITNLQLLISCNAELISAGRVSVSGVFICKYSTFLPNETHLKSHWGLDTGHLDYATFLPEETRLKTHWGLNNPYLHKSHKYCKDRYRRSVLMSVHLCTSRNFHGVVQTLMFGVSKEE